MAKTTVIKRVLMCKPVYFSTINYSINPWMEPGNIDGKKSIAQWESLVNIYKKLKIKVEQIDPQPGSPDMLFATDQGIVQGRNVLLSRFRHKERRAETGYYEKWFFEHAYNISYLPENHFFEGNGESYFWNEYLFVGTGYRSDIKTSEYLTKIFKHKVIPLHIIDPAFYHLDVGFFPLNSETIFYYPSAYSLPSQRILEKMVPNLIPFTREEAYGFCGNSVVTGRNVIHQSGNLSFVKKLKDMGYISREVDLSEIKKSGGGAHCLTNILEEIYA